MFSPYYAWARRRGAARPQNHVAVNAVLYRPQIGGKHWAMTERGEAALHTSAHRLQIGPSALAWDGAALTITLDEWTFPAPRRLRGTIRVVPAALTQRAYTLDAAGRHRWSPLAPVSRVEVALDHPALRWSGPGYFDTNEGDAPLEQDFYAWDWCRAATATGATILYNATRRDGSNQALALRVARDGAVDTLPPLPHAPLPRTLWGMAQSTHADAGVNPAVLARLEDTPFYARSVLDTQLYGTRAIAVQEALSLRRFAAPLVQAMLPFRIPRRAG